MSKTAAQIPLSSSKWQNCGSSGLVCSQLPHICKICNFGTCERSTLLEHMREAHQCSRSVSPSFSDCGTGSVCASPNSSSNEAWSDSHSTVQPLKTTNRSPNYRLTPTRRPRKPKTVQLSPPSSFMLEELQNSSSQQHSSERLTEEDLLVEAFAAQCSRVPLLGGPPSSSLPSLRVQIVRDAQRGRTVAPTHDEHERPLPESLPVSGFASDYAAGNYDQIHYDCDDEAKFENKRARTFYNLGATSTAVAAPQPRGIADEQLLSSPTALPSSFIDEHLIDEIDPDFIAQYGGDSVQLENVPEAAQFQLAPEPTFANYFKPVEPVEMVELVPSPTPEEEATLGHTMVTRNNRRARKRSAESAAPPAAKKRKTAKTTTTQRGRLAKPIATSTVLKGNKLIIGKQTIKLSQSKALPKISKTAPRKLPSDHFKRERKEQPIVRDKYGHRLCLTPRL